MLTRGSRRVVGVPACCIAIGYWNRVRLKCGTKPTFRILTRLIRIATLTAGIAPTEGGAAGLTAVHERTSPCRTLVCRVILEYSYACMIITTDQLTRGFVDYQNSFGFNEFS